MNNRLLLVSVEGEACDAYVDALESLNVSFDIVSTFSKAQSKMTLTAYSGVIVDLATSIKGDSREKRIAGKVYEIFPLTMVNWDESTETILVLAYGEDQNVQTLEDFIADVFTSFDARTLRSHVRKPIHYNVIISKTRDFNVSDSIHSVIINISDGGCFIYAIDEWAAISKVWIKMPKLSNVAPIMCEVRRQVPWGESHQIPGIGMTFKKSRAA